MPRAELSTIDDTLADLGSVPDDVSRQVQEHLGQSRITAQQADEMLAALETTAPVGVRADHEMDEDEAVALAAEELGVDLTAEAEEEFELEVDPDEE